MTSFKSLVTRYLIDVVIKDCKEFFGKHGNVVRGVVFVDESEKATVVCHNLNDLSFFQKELESKNVFINKVENLIVLEKFFPRNQNEKISLIVERCNEILPKLCVFHASPLNESDEILIKTFVESLKTIISFAVKLVQRTGLFLECSSHHGCPLPIVSTRELSFFFSFLKNLTIPKVLCIFHVPDFLELTEESDLTINFHHQVLLEKLFLNAVQKHFPSSFLAVKIRDDYSRDVYFGVVVLGESEKEVKKMAEKVEEEVRSNGTNIHHGISSLPVYQKDENSFLLAFFQAKSVLAQRQNAQKTYESEKRKHLLLKLQEVIKNKKIKLYAQPIFDIEKEKILGYEILTHPSLNFYELFSKNEKNEESKELLISLMENLKIIRDYDLAVMELTFEKIESFKGKNRSLESLKFFFNTSVTSFHDSYYPEKVKFLLEKFDINPENVVIEITERQDLVTTVNLLNSAENVRKSGVSLAIDDWGCYLSGFHLMKNLPVSFFKVKVEKTQDVLEKDYFQFVYQFLKAQQKEVIFECIDSYEKLRKIKEVNAKYAQGFLLGKKEKLEVVLEKESHGKFPREASRADTCVKNYTNESEKRTERQNFQK